MPTIFMRKDSGHGVFAQIKVYFGNISSCLNKNVHHSA